VPWRTTNLVSIREEFVQLALSGRHPVAALCNAYGISEKTGHKWLNRFKDEGRSGLSDRSHAPREIAHRISPAVRREILALREKHPAWGPRKLRVILRGKMPNTTWPAASTIGELLRREGYVQPSRRRILQWVCQLIQGLALLTLQTMSGALISRVSFAY
jgi:transposase-like protein